MRSCLIYQNVSSRLKVFPCSHLRSFATSYNVNPAPRMQFASPNPRKSSLFSNISPINQSETIYDVPPNVLNLSAETYRDDNGEPWILPIVQEVEKMLLTEKLTKNYSEQSAAFVEQATRLILGPLYNSTKENIVALQTVSVTGALRLGFEFCKRILDLKDVYIANPSWSDYGIILSNTGITTVREYPYWNYERRCLAFDEMYRTLSNAEPGSLVLLQCGHNPTGIDPDLGQWRRLAEMMKDHDLIPFFDIANIGLCSGSPEEDAAPISIFQGLGLEFFVAQSFSKNFGLYGERVGNLIVVSKNSSKTREVKEYLNSMSRGLWTYPPLYGARIITKILQAPYLKQQWMVDLQKMVMRTQRARKELRQKLTELGTPGTWNHITESTGLYCVLGLSPNQIRYMAKKHGCYVSPVGRVNVCILTTENIDQIAAAIDDAARQDV